MSEALQMKDDLEKVTMCIPRQHGHC